MTDRSGDLKSRLRRLRGQTTAGEEGQDGVAATARPSLAERVRRLSIGRGPTARAAEPCVETLVEALGAEPIAPGILRIERHLAPSQRHGRASLGPVAGSELKTLSAFGWISPDLASAARVDARLVCLDTETSGLSGGTGTWAFLTGMLRATPQGWTLRQYLLTRLDAEPAYLEAIASELRDAELVVSYNGLSFDLPLLATRFRLVGQANPLADLPHLDLLWPVRRAFGRVWPDCRLASVEQRLLGFERADDLPGAEAPAAWLAWLHAGRIEPLGGVLRHNRWDLASLAALIPRLLQVYEDPGAFAADVRAVAAHHVSRGEADRALRLLGAERARLDRAGWLDLARLHRRRGDWAEARAIWESLAEVGEATACLELAKYYEHRAHDIARALVFASALPPGPSTEARRARLVAKLEAAAWTDALGEADAAPAALNR